MRKPVFPRDTVDSSGDNISDYNNEPMETNTNHANITANTVFKKNNSN
jgi:hypothetical protein